MPDAELVPSVVDRIKRTLVGLKMPRALEILDVTVRRIERGEISALEAIDALLAEELTLRENRRIKTALHDGQALHDQDARRLRLLLPALARQQPHHGARRAGVHRPRAKSSTSSARPAPAKAISRLALGVEAVKAGRSVYFITLADIVGSLAKAEREGTPAREDPLLLPLRSADRRRDRLPARHSRRRQLCSSSSSTPATRGAP